MFPCFSTPDSDQWFISRLVQNFTIFWRDPFHLNQLVEVGEHLKPAGQRPLRTDFRHPWYSPLEIHIQLPNCNSHIHSLKEREKITFTRVLKWIELDSILISSLCEWWYMNMLIWPLLRLRLPGHNIVNYPTLILNYKGFQTGRMAVDSLSRLQQ